MLISELIFRHAHFGFQSPDANGSCWHGIAPLIGNQGILFYVSARRDWFRMTGDFSLAAMIILDLWFGSRVQALCA